MPVQNKLRQEKPWATDPKYFKNVKVSALALLKMVWLTILTSSVRSGAVLRVCQHGLSSDLLSCVSRSNMARF